VLFSSPTFFLFFLAYLLLHFLLPLRLRMPLIIVASTLFYGWWNWAYVWIPYVLLATAYAGALWVDARPRRESKGRVAAVVVALFVPLVIYKYTNFFYQDVLGPILGVSGQVVDLALPLGISFITFTMISYVVDVHRGNYPVERRFSVLAGYTVFFPQLVAGPILRPIELIPQLDPSRPAVLNKDTALGVLIFTMGLVKKLVFADPLAEVIEPVYLDALGLSAWDYLLAIYGFSVQIFCDFSGYTDMAIGSALVLGVRLPNNFERPYISASITEFWQRWHITLSHWLRDYLYIPLGGNRKGFPREILNVFITMGLGGLWHGASFNFVLWGLLHGTAIALAHLIRRTRLSKLTARLPHFVPVVVTFHVVTLAWVFFRASDVGTVRRVLAGPLVADAPPLGDFLAGSAFPVSLVLVFFLLCRFDDYERVRNALDRWNPIVLWSIAALGWLLAIVVSTGSSQKFIYFDF
jgi:alginate O-acetyltransferase complex protein AlgI